MITVHGFTVSDAMIWKHLADPLSDILQTIANSKHNPAVSYRHCNVLCLALARCSLFDPNLWDKPRSEPFTIVLGANASPYEGVQRRCAEWQAAMTCISVRQSPFAAITGGPSQIDDSSHKSWGSSGAIVTCCDCRPELKNDFGWSLSMPMRFCHLDDPRRYDEGLYDEILKYFQEADSTTPRKAVLRAA